MSRVCALNASQSWENDKCCMAWLLSKQDDFVNQVSMLETFINEAGHECIFLPKFHCELNPIKNGESIYYINLFYTKIPLFSTGDGSSTDIKIRHSKMRRMRRWLRSTHFPLMSLGNSSIALGGLWMLIGFHSPEKPRRGQFASRRVTTQFPRGQ